VLNFSPSKLAFGFGMAGVLCIGTYPLAQVKKSEREAKEELLRHAEETAKAHKAAEAKAELQRQAVLNVNRSLDAHIVKFNTQVLDAQKKENELQVKLDEAAKN